MSDDKPKFVISKRLFEDLIDNPKLHFNTVDWLMRDFRICDPMDEEKGDD